MEREKSSLILEVLKKTAARSKIAGSKVYGLQSDIELDVQRVDILCHPTDKSHCLANRR